MILESWRSWRSPGEPARKPGESLGPGHPPSFSGARPPWAVLALGLAAPVRPCAAPFGSGPPFAVPAPPGVPLSAARRPPRCPGSAFGVPSVAGPGPLRLPRPLRCVSVGGCPGLRFGGAPVRAAVRLPPARAPSPERRSTPNGRPRSRAGAGNHQRPNKSRPKQAGPRPRP